MSFRNKLGVLRYTIKREVTRRVITSAVGFGAKRLIVFLTPGFDSPNGGMYIDCLDVSGVFGAQGSS